MEKVLESEATVSEPALGLADLPSSALRRILSYLSFHQVAHLRPVCKAFNTECGAALTAGAVSFLDYTAARKDIEKTKIRNFHSHPRWHARRIRYDQLFAIHTKVKAMYWKYGNYLLEKKCCFIAGKILDEAWRYVAMFDRRCSARVLGDLMFEIGTDLCSMAEEHFQEVIVPKYLEPKPIVTYFPFCDRCTEREKVVKVKSKSKLSAFWRKKAREVREKIRVRMVKVSKLEKQLFDLGENYYENVYSMEKNVDILKPFSKWEVEGEEVQRNPFYPRK